MPGRNGLAVLKITDGTQSVNLLANKNGFGLRSWRPSLAALRGGGIWHEPPFADGRRLIHYNFENVIDTFELTINAETQDVAIAETRKLRQLLQKGRDYWKTRWAYQPVWIEARGSSESMTRYGFIHDWATPNDSNPYTMPFFNCDSNGVVIEDFSLIVEHSIWQDALPNTPTCIPINSYFPRHINYVTLDGNNHIDFASPAALDNLTLADFTAEGWIRIPIGTSFGSDTPLFYKGNIVTGGWALVIKPGERLQGHAAFAGTDPFAVQTVGSLADGLWHHVALTFNSGGDTIKLWVDGVDVTGASTAGTGAPNDDAAGLFTIGYSSGGFVGDIGWVRISIAELYTGAFTPPPRWKMPGIDAGTVGVWIWEGYGNIVHNLKSSSAVDGDLTPSTNLPEWGSDMDFVAGYMDGATYDNNPANPVLPVGGCDVEGLFFTNSHHYTELTSVFNYDASAGTYSANLLTTPLDYYLFPQFIAAGDIAYFFANSGGDFGGTFSNIVLNLLTDMGHIFIGTYAWEYYNGGWVTLESTASDVRESPDNWNETLGPYMMSFTVPSDWVPVTVNGVTGYAVRLRILTFSDGWSPTQVDNQIYTVTWPYLEIPATSVSGDLPAITRLILQNLSDDDAAEGRWRNTDTIYMGLRSVSRGDHFTAYINLSDVQKIQNWTLTHEGAGAAFYSDVAAPTGRCLRYNPVLATTDETILEIWINEDIEQYYGAYRVFLRGVNEGGFPDDIARLTFKLSVGRSDDTSEANILWESDERPWISVGTSALIDFGELILPPYQLRHDEQLQTLVLHIRATNPDTDYKAIRLYDIILIPVDEWFASITQSVDPTSSYDGVVNGFGIMLDSVGHPKQSLRVLGLSTDLNDIVFNFRVDGTPMMLQANTAQRLWFFTLSHDDTVLRFSRPDLVHGGKMAGANRYFSMRGAT